MDLKSNHICYSLTGPVSVLAKSRPNEIAANGTHLDEAPAITSTRAFLLRGQPDTLICTSIVSAYLFWSAWGQRQTRFPASWSHLGIFGGFYHRMSLIPPALLAHGTLHIVVT